MKDETELQSDGLYGGIKFKKKGACESKMKKSCLTDTSIFGKMSLIYVNAGREVLGNTSSGFHRDTRRQVPSDLV